MKNTIVHKAASRGYANHGWLKSFHTFSFAGYMDENRIHFGELRVLNDDIVAGGKGFGEHPHKNMEIISIPLYGALQHRDSTGHSEVIKPGDIQIMSAGTGLYHSEFNASQTEDVNFLQLWIFPKDYNSIPRYDQKFFSPETKNNQWQKIVGPEKTSEFLQINQDANLSLANLSINHTLDYQLKSNLHGIYLFVINGSIRIDGIEYQKRDGIGIAHTDKITIDALSESQILAIEVPMLTEE